MYADLISLVYKSVEDYYIIVCKHVSQKTRNTNN